MSTFFGLTPNNCGEVRAALFSQIHEIVFHGKGGYDWNTIYNMPIWLRKFTFNKIKEFYEKEAEAANKESNTITPSNINVPDSVKSQAVGNQARNTQKPGYLTKMKAS